MTEQKKEAEVKVLFHEFQKSREQITTAQQDKIMNTLSSGQAVSPADAEADSEAEKKVIDHYRRYMAQRDPNREEVITEVTGYARKQHQAVSQNVQQAAAQSGDSLATTIFNWPGKMLSRMTQWIGNTTGREVANWQLALPALAMLGIVFLLVQGTGQPPGSSHQVAWNNTLPATIASQSDALLEKLQPSVSSTFGFSAQPGKLGSSFELGQSIARLELALEAQSTQHIPRIVKRADNLTRELGLPPLSGQIDLQEDSVSLDAISQRWFEKSPEQTAFYQLGFWMETTDFAVKLAEMAFGLEALEQQLKSLGQLKANHLKVLQQHPLQLRQLEKLAATKSASLKTHAGLQMFKRQLARCIAVFKNP